MTKCRQPPSYVDKWTDNGGDSGGGLGVSVMRLLGREADESLCRRAPLQIAQTPDLSTMGKSFTDMVEFTMKMFQ